MSRPLFSGADCTSLVPQRAEDADVAPDLPQVHTSSPGRTGHPVPVTGAAVAKAELQAKSQQPSSQSEAPGSSGILSQES